MDKLKLISREVSFEVGSQKNHKNCCHHELSHFNPSTGSPIF